MINYQQIMRKFPMKSNEIMEIGTILTILDELDIESIETFLDEELFINSIIKGSPILSFVELSEQIKKISDRNVLNYLEKYPLEESNPCYGFIIALQNHLEGKELLDTNIEVKLRDLVRELITILRHKNIHVSEDFSLFWNAIENDNAHMIRAFITSDEINIEATNYYAENLLHISAKFNAVEVFKAFYESGLDLNSMNCFKQTPLHIALYNNSTEVAKYILTQYPILYLTDDLGNTPLHIACAINSQLAISLMKMGASVFTKNKAKDTPLHLAIIFDNIEIVEYIIENYHIGKIDKLLFMIAANDSVNSFIYLKKYPLNLNIKDKNGMAPLHLTTIYNSYKIASLLLEHGANVNIATKEGVTPLHNSAAKGLVDFVKLFIENGADVNAMTKGGFTPIQNSILFDQKEIIEILVHAEANVNSAFVDGFNALHYATGEGDYVLAKLLLEHGADVNSKTKEGVTSLHNAAYKGNIEMIQLLLDYHADVNMKSVKGITPLHNALYEGKIDVIVLLVENQADVNVIMPEGITPLIYAIMGENPKLASTLILHGANIHTKYQGETPLFYSFIVGSPKEEKAKLIQLLIDKGADIKKRFQFKLTALHLALFNNYDEISKRLIDKNIHLNSKDKDGFTPIFKAIENNKVELVKLLLSKRVSVNIKAKKSAWTPLHEAIKQENLEMIRLLLNHNADITSKTKTGITPIKLAELSKNQEVINYLKDFKKAKR